jgi:hypothetical protein
MSVALMSVAAGALAAASPAAAAWYQRYQHTSYFPPGAIGSSSYNRITFNAAHWVNCCGGTPYMGTQLTPPGGPAYSPLYSNTGSIFDSRTISYGYAICRASPGNNYDLIVDYCDTGNG